MTLNEFKAWFEGFIENLNGLPNREEWERICLKIKNVDGDPTTETVFIDRYWAHPGRPWDYPTRWSSSGDGIDEAFRALGRAEFDHDSKQVAR